MDKKLKSKWLKALRSGKYKQAKGVLRNTRNGFCCLGVLCDVVDKSQWSSAPKTIETAILDRDANIDGYAYQGAETTIPGSLRERFEYSEHEHISQLIEMNDGGKRFTTIADYIEEKL